MNANALNTSPYNSPSHPILLLLCPSKLQLAPAAACNMHVSHDVTNVERCVCGGGDAREGLACDAMIEIAWGHARGGGYGGWAHAMLR